jgi:hypothetical protein
MMAFIVARMERLATFLFGAFVIALLGAAIFTEHVLLIR